MEAARKVLQVRLAQGGGQTGWSRSWIVNFYARLLQGNLAHEHLQALFQQKIMETMLDTHPPFQIDGNFGGRLVSAKCCCSRTQAIFICYRRCPTHGLVDRSRACVLAGDSRSIWSGTTARSRKHPSGLNSAIRAPCGMEIGQWSFLWERDRQSS